MLLLKPMYRVITFVPPEYLAGVLESIRRIIPLRYGLYDSVARVCRGYGAVQTVDWSKSDRW